MLYETARLNARWIMPRDIDALMAVDGDELAMCWVGDGDALSLEDGLKWIEVTQANYKQRDYGMSVVCLSSTDDVLGFCGLVHPAGQQLAEIKYAFQRSSWSQGFASEAVQGMLSYGTQSHGLLPVIACVHPDNLASQRVLTKAGMQLAETRKEEDGSRTLVFQLTD